MVVSPCDVYRVLWVGLRGILPIFYWEKQCLWSHLRGWGPDSRSRVSGPEAPTWFGRVVGGQSWARGCVAAVAGRLSDIAVAYSRT